MDLPQRDRERQVVEILRTFLLTAQAFRQQKEKYHRESLRFADLAKLIDDRGQSVLFALKERCQSLFRRRESRVSEKEQIFDLTVGTLFHLAMKLREDLYQLEFYGPKVKELGERGDGLTDRKALLRQFEELISRARNSFRDGMEEIATLLQEILPQFIDLLQEHRGNGLLVRFLIEERELVEGVLGEGALEKLFQAFYGPGMDQPYRLAGESYFQSGFYGRAAQVLSQALENNPDDEQLLFIHHLSQGMLQFYSFDPQRALKSLEKCVSCDPGKELLEDYRERIRLVCRKIREEFPGRRKSDQHRDLVKKARTLQRQLEKMCTQPEART